MGESGFNITGLILKLAVPRKLSCTRYTAAAQLIIPEL
jgi:hypothetical protein